MTKRTVRKNNHLYKGLKSSLSRASKDLKARASHFVKDSISQTRDKSMELRDDLSDYVSHKPFKSLGAALLTGAIIGFFMHRR